MSETVLPPQAPPTDPELMAHANEYFNENSRLVTDYVPQLENTGRDFGAKAAFMEWRGNGYAYWYDLRRPEDVGDLLFLQALDQEVDYEFVEDDQFVLFFREGHAGHWLECRVIVFGPNGEVRLHKRYYEGPCTDGKMLGFGKTKVTDCKPNEGLVILGNALRNAQSIPPEDLMQAHDPGLREFAMEAFMRSLRPLRAVS